MADNIPSKVFDEIQEMVAMGQAPHLRSGWKRKVKQLRANFSDSMRATLQQDQDKHAAKELTAIEAEPNYEYTANEAKDYVKIFKTYENGKYRYLMHVNVFDYEHLSGEAYTGCDLVVVENTHPAEGEEAIKYLKVFKKAVITGAGTQEIVTLKQVKRLEDLAHRGIPTVEIYGVEKATIYEGFYDNSREAAWKCINEQGEGWQELLRQMVRIAVRLDDAKYGSSHFTDDLIFDGTLFRYADTGGDIDIGGTHFDTEIYNARNALTTQFRKQEEVIMELYEEEMRLLKLERERTGLKQAA